MLNSAVVVDLPSAVTDRHKTPLEWLRSAFGAKLDLRGDHEELTISAMSLVAGLVEGFSKAGVTDVISFVVDKKVVYIDSNEVPDDLAVIWQAAEQKGILERRFSEMHLVLSHKEAGLHVLIDARIRNRVLLGEEEMTVVFSARVEELKIQPGETPSAYRARIEAYMSDETRADANRVALDALTARVADDLGKALVGAARVQTYPATVRIIAPEERQVARFRKLRFGNDVEGPRYRAVPTYQRAGAYADPFYYYYYDPYYDFMSWVMLDSMLHHQYWNVPTVQVIDTGGNMLGTGDAVESATSRWAGRDAVSFGDDGGLQIASSIPGADTGHTSSWFGGGDSSSGGDSSWGGGDTGSSSDGGSSSCSSSSDGGSSSCSSSSSCGSSCSSGSSCGSSCGGS
jgi:hypothetical protein